MWLHVPATMLPSAPEVEDLTSPSDSLCQMLAASCTWKTKSAQPASWRRVLRTTRWTTRLSGLTYEPSTLKRGVESWMASLEDFLAPPTPSQGSKPEPTTPATSGPSVRDSYEKPDPDGPSLKTWAEAFGTTTDASDQTLRALATGTRQASSRRRKSVRRTSESDSSSWPTVDARSHWATPTSRDHKDGVNPSNKVETNSLLGRQAPRTPMLGPQSSENAQTSRRRLNPQFVEWLMGWPMGWTSLAASNCKSSETEWSRWWLRMRSELSRLTSE